MQPRSELVRRLEQPAIGVRQLRKTYPGGVEAVKGIDFQVVAGEVFGLLGPNGAGTTTIGMLTTTIAPPAAVRTSPASTSRASRSPLVASAASSSRTRSSTTHSPAAATSISTPASGESTRAQHGAGSAS